MTSTTQYTPLTRHITLNSATDSKASSFLQNDTIPPMQPTGPKSQVSYIYSSPPSFSITKNTDLEHHNKTTSVSFPAAGGSACVAVDFAPDPEGKEGNMHKTDTLDYIVVVEGELELSLYGGKGEEVERRVVKKGEVVVQRACMHAWRNLSKTERARIIAVAVGSEGAVEGGGGVPRVGSGSRVCRRKRLERG
jgi:quercetin dioxygenase-like cupin family protein